MRLTLTVLRCPPAVTPETRILEGGEFTVGRGPGVDWVLADPEQMVSRRHFAAVFRGGDWQIADESANGTFVNHDAGPIGKGNKRTLRDRDRLRAGPYEIEVHLEALDAVHDSPSYGHADPEPYGYADPAPNSYASTIPEDAFDDPFHESFGSLDAAPSFGTPFVQQTQADHSSVLQDAMRPPAPTGEFHAHTGGLIPADDLLPDDWEKDLLEGIGDPAPVSHPIPANPFAPNSLAPNSLAPDPFAPVPQSPAPPRLAPMPSAPPAPNRVDPDPFAAEPLPSPAVHAAPVVPSPRVHAPPETEPSIPEDPFLEPAVYAAPPPEPVFAAPAPPPAVPAVVSPVAPTTAAVAGDTGLLAAFLTGVGLPDARPADPATTMQRLGEAFRTLVAGLRAVLIARASIKSEFRIEQTLIRARGNNPLKFSADDDDAISALLGVGRRTDMTPATAVQDALRDIRLHELASMAAMQAAVRTVLDGLHPDKVRTASEQGGGMSMLPGQKKARAWDAYEALHTRTVQALSDDFDSVFGKAFARAYEDALEDLSAKEKK
jgi:type VI secretion system FHA domain protein